MKFAIPTIPDVDLDLANSAMVGAETVVSVSYTDVQIVGSITQGADVPSSVLEPENAYNAPAGTAGRDLQLVCDNGCLSSEEIILQLNVTLEGTGTPAGTAKASLLPPSYATDDTFNMPIGLAVDMKVDDRVVTDGATTSGSPNVTSATANFTTADVGKGISGAGIPAGATILSRTSATVVVISANASATGAGVTITISNSLTKIRTVTGIAAITGGHSGNRYKLISLPDDFTSLMCAMDKNPTIPSQKAIAIPCGYNPARWVKKGRSDVPNLELSAKYTSGGDGLMRLNGHRITAMLEAIKDDRLLTERSIFWGWRPAIVPRHGDGDTEDEVRATGLYEAFAMFV